MIFINKNGEKVQLDSKAIISIGNALSSLASLDMHAPILSPLRIALSQNFDFVADKMKECDKHLRSISALFSELKDDQLYVLSLYLSISSLGHRPPGRNPGPSTATSRIDEVYRTLKLIAANPGWFSDVIASINMDPSRKQQDPWLYHTLDELCEILKKRNVIVTRNPDSAPFGLLMDSLSVVRPSITAAQVGSYLKQTRQGLRKSDFGRRWGEIEDDLPKAEIAPSHPSDLDPGAGSDRHPSETT